MLMANGHLYTNATITNEFKVWDVRSWLDSTYGDPDMLFELKTVYALNICPDETGALVLVVAKENCIEVRPLYKLLEV